MMNLVSCDNCGVVVDCRKLNFPTELYIDDDTGGVDFTKAVYDSDSEQFVGFVTCPVCSSKILNRSE